MTSGPSSSDPTQVYGGNRRSAGRGWYGPPAGWKVAELADWLAAVQGQAAARPITRPRLLVFAADHGVAVLDVSARPAGSASALVRAMIEGTSPAAILARQYGAAFVIDMALDLRPGRTAQGRHRAPGAPGRAGSTSRTR